MKGKIVDQGFGKNVQGEDGLIYPITRFQKELKLKVDQDVVYALDNEYPDCGAFCDGDETCVICYNRNVVAKIQI